MSTLSQVRTAWSSVLSSSNLTSYTANLYKYPLVDIATESTRQEGLARVYGDINFAQFVFSKNEQFSLVRCITQEYQVEISYFLAANTATIGDNYAKVTDFFEALFGTIRSTIGTTWSNTVDFFEYDTEMPSITSTDINGDPVWVGTYTVTGVKQINL